ncbi:hypothetical protein DR950_04515 [Kitasatospora xanthocidica]|uniref:Uncharacterized protein n=1 Tax=Kitasatospora xanthocidica TaxID=83382 RepID=A0A372ZPI3_9ACTN|nr:hypothetical protein [Kitasatospora xanthocidica]RGD57155.1 hypothetical protein DR950_04515 [Kitasatospora xanthocidica]
MDTMKLLAEIDRMVATGKVVTSANDEAVADIVLATITSGTTASFYLTRAQAALVKERFWTPERIRRTGLRPISPEETERIRVELGVRVKNFRCTPITCGCGHVYDAFDFIQQGIREHGLDVVNSVFSLKDSTFLQVNPSFVPICPVDDRRLSRTHSSDGGIEYDCDEYGGCCYQE